MKEAAVSSAPFLDPSERVHRSLNPNTHPRPRELPACEIIASTAGLRIARPARSATISAAATGQLPASARAGTASMFMQYPINVTNQYLCDLSAKYPENDLRP